jgi:hypothetical protein
LLSTGFNPGRVKEISLCWPGDKNKADEFHRNHLPVKLTNVCRPEPIRRLLCLSVFIEQAPHLSYKVRFTSTSSNASTISPTSMLE